MCGPFHAGSARVFGFEGEFLGDFGTEGQGPGEFRSVVEVLEYPEGILNVWDGGNNRFSRFTLDFGFIDQFIPEVQPLRRVFTTSGMLAVNALKFTEAGEVLPLHFMEASGRGTRRGAGGCLDSQARLSFVGRIGCAPRRLLSQAPGEGMQDRHPGPRPQVRTIPADRG